MQALLPDPRPLTINKKGAVYHEPLPGAVEICTTMLCSLLRCRALRVRLLRLRLTSSAFSTFAAGH